MITEADLDANPWASCGPVALAGLLGRPLAEIRHAFPRQVPRRTWTNLAQMREALDRLSVRHAKIEYLSNNPVSQLRAWPRSGLVLIQFTGTWDRLRTAAQLARSHWIAYVAKGERMHGGNITALEDIVFDINAVGTPALARGMFWQQRVEGWEQIMVPLLLEDRKGADGKFWVRDALEVTGG